MKIKHVLKWKIDERIIAVLAVVCFCVLCLLPLLLIARYDHPCADDFGYGYDAHVAWKTTHSLFETIDAAVNTAKHTYYTWQGTFVSIFLMALTPVVFGEQYYAVVPFMMLGVLTASIFYLGKVILHDLLKATYSNTIIVSVIVSFLLIEAIYTPASAFFWYNAAVHYTFMQAMMLFMLAFTVRSIILKQKVISIIACLLGSICAFCVSGGNYLNALIGIVLLVSLLGLFIVLLVADRIKKKPDSSLKFLVVLIPLIVYFVGFVINISAPGNSVRAANFVGASPVIAIIRSFESGFYYSVEWMSFFTIFLMILALPAIWCIVSKSKYRFRFPLLVLLFSFCLFSASFTSSHYSLGEAGLPRTFNNCKMIYQILLFVNEIYLAGWFSRIWKERKGENKVIAFGHGVIFYLIITIALSGVFLLCNDKEAYYPSYASAKYMKQGYALHYHMQHLERLTILSGQERNVSLKEIQPKLNVLYVDDITENPSDWRNTQYARWHGKESVVRIPYE